MRVAAMPPRIVGSASIDQPATGRRRSTSRMPSISAPASTRAPRAMSAVMPGKQWNQATVRRSSATAAPQGQHPGHGHGGTEAVVDADDGEAGGARGEHAEQGGDALEPGAVAGAGRDGHDRAAGDAADDAGERA